MEDFQGAFCEENEEYDQQNPFQELFQPEPPKALVREVVQVEPTPNAAPGATEVDFDFLSNALRDVERQLNPLIARLSPMDPALVLPAAPKEFGPAQDEVELDLDLINKALKEADELLPVEFRTGSDRQNKIQELQRNNKVLTEAAELDRSQYLQQVLINLLPEFPEANAADPRKSVIEEREQLKLEQEAHVFGPASQKAYARYVDFLQTRAVPETVRIMDSFRLPIPAGCPLTLPGDSLNRAVHPELYQSLANTNELRVKMGLDTTKVPSEAQLKRLDAAYDWLEACKERLTTARAERNEQRLNKLIDDGLPSNWRRKPGEDLMAWQSSAAEMIDLASRTRNYLEAMQSLAKTDRYSDMKVSIPRNASLTIEYDNKTYVITADNLKDNMHVFKKGTIKEVKLDLPEDLRQEHPVNAQKIEVLRNWLENNTQEIDKQVASIEKVMANPDSLVMYGDQEIRNGKAVFNEQGEFVRLTKPGEPTKPGEQVKDCNLLGYDFEVEPVPGKPGKFRVTQTITAENAPWYAYENARFLGVERLGSKRLPPIEIDGDDFVPIRNGDKIQMIQAKKLQGYKDWQQFTYYGEKGLTATMDVAMVATGTIEIGAAVRGARLAAVGAEAALKLEGMQAAMQLTKGITRVTVGGAGILNNAGGHDLKYGSMKLGEQLNQARGLYFLGDVSLGLMRGAWGSFKSAREATSGAEAALSGSEKIHSIIHGKTIGSEVLNGIPYIRHAHTGATYGFKASEYAFAPIIASELKHQVEAIGNLGKPDAATDAVVQVGDNRGMRPGDKDAFDPNNKRAYEGTSAMLDGYARTMTEGRSPETKAAVEAIFSDTKRVLGPDASPADRQALAQKLIANLGFTGAEIAELEKAFPTGPDLPLVSLTSEQLSDLRDAEKRKTFPPKVRELAERILSGKDKDIAAASEVALLFITRDSKGNIGASSGEIKISVPEYYNTSLQVKAREVSFKLTTAETVNDLRTMLKDGGNRTMVIGDTLTRIGAMTQVQYAALLQDVLQNPVANRQDKLRALSDPFRPGLSTLIDAIRYDETKPAGADLTPTAKSIQAAENFNLNSKALLKSLEQVAKEDASADVRAMASAQLYALNERNPQRRAELLSAFNTMQQEFMGKPEGEFAAKLREFLRKEMQTPLPKEAALQDAVKERQLNAALALALSTRSQEKDIQHEINLTIARSISETNPALTLRVVEAMLPNRLDQLQEIDRKAAHAFRKALVDMVKLPETLEGEKMLASLLPKMEQLLKNGDTSLNGRLKNELETLLRRDSVNYAEHFPLLRAAAITTLGDMGSQSSLALIRSHAIADDKLQVGVDPGSKAPKEMTGGEKDARVRHAAVRALMRLKDVEMPSYVGYMIDKEIDPTVSTALRDFRFTEQRLERDSQEYKRQYESALAALKDPFREAKYPHLKDFNEGRVAAWLDEHFDMLNNETFKKKATAAVDGDNSLLGRNIPFVSDKSIHLSEYQAALPFHEERVKQWQKLSTLVMSEGVEGDKARKALYYMMWSVPVAGRFGAAGNDEIPSKITKSEPHKFSNFDVQMQSAAMLFEACRTPGPGQDMAIEMLADVFSNRIGGKASQSMGFYLLHSLKKLEQDGAISKEKAASIYAKALDNEIRRPAGDQNQELQAAMVQELRALKNRMMYPAFEAIAEGSKFPAVKQAAADALAELRDSVPAIWNTTTPDLTTSPQERSQKLLAALGQKVNADALIQTIFNSYKGYAFDNPRDPGLAPLALAMNDTNPRVKAAAAMVLVESKLPNDHPVKAQAIATLGYLAKEGFATAHQKQVFESLSRLNLDKPITVLLSDDKTVTISKNGDTIEFKEMGKTTEYSRMESKAQTIKVMTVKPDPSNPGKYISAMEDRTQTIHYHVSYPVKPETSWTVKGGQTTPPIQRMVFVKK